MLWIPSNIHADISNDIMVIYKILLHFVRCIMSTGHGSLELPENHGKLPLK